MPRKCKRQGCSPYAEIRSRREAANVAQYFRLCQNRLNFACLTFEDQEESLIDDESVLSLGSCAKLLLSHIGSTEFCTSYPEERVSEAFADHDLKRRTDRVDARFFRKQS